MTLSKIVNTFGLVAFVAMVLNGAFLLDPALMWVLVVLFAAAGYSTFWYMCLPFVSEVRTGTASGGHTQYVLVRNGWGRIAPLPSGNFLLTPKAHQRKMQRWALVRGLWLDK